MLDYNNYQIQCTDEDLDNWL